MKLTAIAFDMPHAQMSPRIGFWLLKLNSVSAAKNQYGATFEREAYQMLLRLISLDGQEYRLTEHGRHVITVMSTISLKKNKVRIMH